MKPVSGDATDYPWVNSPRRPWPLIPKDAVAQPLKDAMFSRTTLYFPCWMNILVSNCPKWEGDLSQQQRVGSLWTQLIKQVRREIHANYASQTDAFCRHKSCIGLIIHVMLLLIETNDFYFHRKGSKEKGVEEGLYCWCVCLSVRTVVCMVYGARIC